MRRILTIALMTALPGLAFSQDLGNLKDQKPVKFSGSINLNLQTYATTRSRPFREPFLWTLSGNPTLTLYGVSLPFSFVISDRNEEFRQPFNQFGLSPYYKWVRLHLGFRSLSFSRYSLNGHVFNGVGAELTPGNWRLGFMYGRLLEPIPEDPELRVPIQPTYLRKGYSVKVGYGTPNNYVDLILFKGWDVPGSIDRPTDSLKVDPRENLVFGIKTRQRLFDRLTFEADVGLSGLTSNLFAGGSSVETIPLDGVVNSLFTMNYSTQFLTAIHSSLSYRLNFANIRINYQRIDPEYNTFGAYFFNNDLENITVSPSWSMLNRKLRVTASMGWQRNNLAETRVNQMSRRIGSLRISYMPLPKLAISSSYTNYQMLQERRDLIRRDVIDSLQMEQFSNNLSMNVTYILGNDQRKYTILASYNHQSVDQEIRSEAYADNDSRVISPSLTFRFKNKETGWGYKGNLSYNDFKNSSVTSERLGLNASVTRQVSEQLNLSATTSFINTWLDGANGGLTTRLMLRGNFRLQENHNFSITASLVNRNTSNERLEAFSEYIGNFNYTYTF